MNNENPQVQALLAQINLLSQIVKNYAGMIEQLNHELSKELNKDD